MHALRIIIADDHPMFREGVRTILNHEEGMVVIGEAATGEEAVRLAHELSPDVILMDIRMPGMNGIEATARILSANRNIRILMLTMFKDDESVLSGIQAGARGYILKDADKQEIIRAIQAVAAGEAIFDGDIAGRLFALASRPASALDRFPSLTIREKDVLRLLVDGCTNSEISRKLDLSPKTVSNYISSILNKLPAADRAEAIRIVKHAGS